VPVPEGGDPDVKHNAAIGERYGKSQVLKRGTLLGFGEGDGVNGPLQIKTWSGVARNTSRAATSGRRGEERKGSCGSCFGFSGRASVWALSIVQRDWGCTASRTRIKRQRLDLPVQLCFLPVMVPKLSEEQEPPKDPSSAIGKQWEGWWVASGTRIRSGSASMKKTGFGSGE